MTADQAVISLLLVATMSMFHWGRWRHDLVALGALLVCVFTGLIPGAEAFAGFGHPAVITVACVLVLGYGLLVSGAVGILTQNFLPKSAGPTVSILALIGLAALLSAFMNNVGALALLMPIAIQMSAKLDLPPGKVLMPLAFGSILGGMTTLIGTPPNLIVSEFRATTGSQSFAMFDFTPVGLSVALTGIAFIGIIGWRIVPLRKQSDTESFVSGNYLSEVRIIKGSKAIDKSLREVEAMLDEAGAQIISLIRNDVRIPVPNARRILKQDDILIIEFEPESLAAALTSLGLKLEEDRPADTDDKDAKEQPTINRKIVSNKQLDSIEADDADDGKAKNEEVSIQELVVMPDAIVAGRSARSIDLRTRYSINLLAISR